MGNYASTETDTSTTNDSCLMKDRMEVFNINEASPLTPIVKIVDGDVRTINGNEMNMCKVYTNNNTTTLNTVDHKRMTYAIFDENSVKFEVYIPKHYNTNDVSVQIAYITDVENPSFTSYFDLIDCRTHHTHISLANLSNRTVNNAITPGTVYTVSVDDKFTIKCGDTVIHERATNETGAVPMIMFYNCSIVCKSTEDVDAYIAEIVKEYDDVDTLNESIVTDVTDVTNVTDVQVNHFEGFTSFVGPESENVTYDTSTNDDNEHYTESVVHPYTVTWNV
jgi:hypothetical protein